MTATTVPCCFTFQKRASPGIEPGPPAPKAGILPLNYKAFLLLCHRCCCPHHTPLSHTTLPHYHTLLPFLKRGLWRESNPRHLHPKQVFYHLTTKPYYYTTCMQLTSLFSPSNKQWAPPGIEPGPLAPEASILPLNYEAYMRILSITPQRKKKGTIGFEPMTTGTAVLCSTTELCALLLLLLLFP